MNKQTIKIHGGDSIDNAEFDLVSFVRSKLFKEKVVTLNEPLSATPLKEKSTKKEK